MIVCARCHKIHFDEIPLDVKKELDDAGKRISEHIDEQIILNMLLTLIKT